jgi:alpha-tubulin suppressor-like RCC1 family protein
MPTAVAGGRTFKQVNPGNAHTCAVGTDARAYCWGYNGFGQLGDGGTSDRSTPHAVGDGRSYTQVVAGVSYTCGVTGGKRAFCWGENGFGELGNASMVERHVPTAVADGLELSGISPGSGHHTCALSPSNVVYCWGHNIYGQLGLGFTFGPDLCTVAALSCSIRPRQIVAPS